MPRLLFVDCWPDVRPDGDWRPRFSEVPRIAAQCDAQITVLHHSRIDPQAMSATAPDGIMLSGSSFNLMEDPTQDPEDGVALTAFARLTEALALMPEVPVLGICFGFQYLMFAAGGRLCQMARTRKEESWPIDPVGHDPLFVGLPSPRLVESHRWVVERCAPEYQVVARSVDGIEAARHGRMPRIGVQFHPEYCRRPGATPDGERILVNWIATL